MIKVQPARSRILKTESSERIVLTMPRKGLVGLGGCLLGVGLLWLTLVGVILWPGLRSGSTMAAIAAAIAAVPGLALIVGGLADVLKGWSVERDSSWVLLRVRGILGTRVQRWPVQDVASFFPQIFGTEDKRTGWLTLGFRNGRSELLVTGEWEDIAWASAMLTEPRGTRKLAPALQIAAEPERRKINPEIVPPTLICRTYEGGVDIVFRPLLRARGLWWRLPLAAILGILAVVVVSLLLHRATHGGFPLAIPRLTIGAVVGFAGWRFWVLSKSAVIQVSDGLVYIVQNPGQKRIQFGKVDVEFVQTFRAAGHTELQFLLKGQPKVRLFDGRPAEELEWAARFLRVAIKGRQEPETSAMKVDAAAGECQVCLEKMESRVVYCAKCRTPHHEECWSYMGMCSTYGCREIRFERK
jgi:hypothetical protein